MPQPFLLEGGRDWASVKVVDELASERLDEESGRKAVVASLVQLDRALDMFGLPESKEQDRLRAMFDRWDGVRRDHPREAAALRRTFAGHNDVIADHRRDVSPAAGALTDVLVAARKASYTADKVGGEADAAECNRLVAAYRADYLGEVVREARVAGFESEYNRFAPYYLAANLYVVVLLVGFVGWLTPGRVVARTAFWLAAATLALHAFALIGRMYIQGRPPVTNLYSSAVFIGFGAMAMGLALESVFRNGFATVVGAAIAAGTAMVGHSSPRRGAGTRSKCSRPCWTPTSGSPPTSSA